MKTIPLSQGKIALVDDSDFADLSQFKWYAYKSENTFYAQREIRDNGKRTSKKMHRHIMNAKSGEQVDHTNHNGLDCQRTNLRLCTTGQNQWNRKRNSNGSSEYKGVQWRERDKKWQAQIGYKGKRIHLGYFSDEIAAAQTYDAKATELFGTFAHLNFPN